LNNVLWLDADGEWTLLDQMLGVNLQMNYKISVKKRVSNRMSKPLWNSSTTNDILTAAS